MAKGKLFEYALIYHPKKEKDEEQKPSELIGDVKHMIAATPEVVNMRAIREIPDEYAEKLEQIEVAVRPF